MTRPMQPEGMLCFDIYALHQAFGRLYKPLLEPLGLTYPQYLVMVVLWGDSPQSVGQIGHRLGLESSTLTPLVKRLEGAGLVTRTRDAEDERRVLVHLTEQGKVLADKARGVPACVLAATEMSEAEIGDLRAALAKVQHALVRNS